ncbi:MAG: AAA domain-containing protein [Bacteroidota bacterium]
MPPFFMTKQEHLAFFSELAETLLEEKVAESRLYADSHKHSPIHQRVEAGHTWYPIEIVEEGYGLGSYPFLVLRRHKGPKRHFFRAGQSISCFSNHIEHAHAQITGRIVWVSENEMKISFRTDELPDFIGEGKVGVNAAFDERSYVEMMKALNAVINAEKNQLSALRDSFLENANNSPQAIAISEELNQSQTLAVQDMFSENPWVIIHGPPGTGKTTTLVRGILKLIESGKKILVCAPTNAAVDHLVDSLGEFTTSIVRIGNPERVTADALKYTLEVKAQAHNQFSKIKEWKKKAIELRKLALKYKRNFGKEEAKQRSLILKEAKALLQESKDMERYILGQIIDESQIVCATLVGASNEMLSSVEFDVGVIDEAAQSIEPATWIPALKVKRMVLAGDPFQLPATLFSSQSKQKGLGISLMERSLANGRANTMLNIQYRMNEFIAGFSNSEFYRNNLIADSRNKNWLCSPLTPPLMFVDTAGTGYSETGRESGNSLINKGELDVLRKLILELNENIELENFSLSLITPYRAQASLMEEIQLKGEVSINTIDSFQGQESDVVIISLVRSNDEKELGFLNDIRRMNVALTRARKCLRVIGDSSTIGAHPFYSAFIEYCEKNNSTH